MQSALLVQENTATGGVTRITEHLMSGLTAQGWRTASVSLRGGPWFTRLRAIWASLGQHNVLIATHNFLPTYATWLLATVSRKPWVMWVHGPVIPVLAMAQARPAKRSFLRWIYQRAPLVVFGSQAAQDSFEQFTWPDDAPPAAGQQLRTVIHNATTIDRTGLPPGHPEGSVHIGFVGRLSAEKQPLQLLDLLEQLPEPFVLHVVGDGPLMADMQRQGQNHLASGRLHLHGAQTVTASTYMAWQATVLCSAYEGYPMTALESLACGVPCVSTPIPAMQEMLHAQAPYMLAARNTPEALAQALIATLQTPAAQRQQDMAAITQAHTPEKFAAAWSQLLHLAIQTHNPPGANAPGPQT
jgi:glycosyltransferase involved in cell wall biosynthesis